MNPEQAQDLVDHFGGQRAAARALGMPLSTLHGWLDPQKAREARRRYNEKKSEDPAWVEREDKRKQDWYYNLHGPELALRQLKSRRRQALSRRKRRESGLCANCGEPRLSEWYCWDCLNKKETGRILSHHPDHGVAWDAPVEGIFKDLRKEEG